MTTIYTVYLSEVHTHDLGIDGIGLGLFESPRRSESTTQFPKPLRNKMPQAAPALDVYDEQFVILGGELAKSILSLLDSLQRLGTRFGCFTGIL